MPHRLPPCRFVTNPAQSFTEQLTAFARHRGYLDRATLALLESLTGMKVEPIIRVYPTREAFRDAGGTAVNLQGATRGRNIKLPPAASVATLRHELLHAILESNTKLQQPEWFREGLVQALLNEKSDAASRAAAMLREKGKAQTLLYWKNGLPAAL